MTKTSLPLDQLRIMTAVFLLNFNGGVISYFGNLNAYMESYIQFKHSKNRWDINPSWILSIGIAFVPIGFFLASTLRLKLGPRFTVLLGAASCGGGFTFSYFSIMYSVWATTITFGAVGLLGVGVVEVLSFSFTAAWFPKNQGLVGSIAGIAGNCGSIVFNYISTAYANPRNLKPDVFIGNKAYFSQTEVIDRVPDIFLLLGGITTVMQFLGLLLLKNAQNDEIQRNDNDNSNSSSNRTDSGGQIGISNEMIADPSETVIQQVCELLKHQRCNLSSDKNVELKKENIPLNGGIQKQSTQLNVYGLNDVESIHANCSTSFIQNPNDIIVVENNTAELSDITVTNGVLNTEGIQNCEFQVDTNADIQSEAPDTDLSPKQMLRSLNFYLTGVCLISEAFVLFIVTDYYKVFAQIWIQDDKFLTTVGNTAALTSLGFRAAVGYSTDKLSIKSVLLGVISITSVCLFFWYFSARFQFLVLYAILTNVLSGLAGSVFILFPLVTLKLFGYSHFTTNTGLVMLAMSIINVISAPVAATIRDDLGWMWLFCLAGSLAMVSTLPLLLFMPRSK